MSIQLGQLTLSLNNSINTNMTNFIAINQPPIDFSILIPVFNSEKSLPLVLKGIREQFSKLNHSYEIVLVDDGSSDNSWQMIQQEHKQGDICAIRFIKNQGHSVALKRAFEFCQGEWVITMDDDLQHPPHELPKLISAALDNAQHIDIVMGSYDSTRSSWHKTAGAKVYQSILRSAYSLPNDLRITSFRVIHRRIVDEVIRRDLANPHAGFMLLAATNRIMNVPVEYHDRQHGMSGMSLRKSVTTLLDGLALNSVLPLKIIGFGGLTLAAAAIFLALYYVFLYFGGGIGLSGYASIIIFITFFSGIIMASISIVGLYIMRLIQQTTFSPHYSLRDYLPKEN